MCNSAFRSWLQSLGLDAGVVGHTVKEAFPFLPEQVFEEYRTVLATGRPLITEELTQPAALPVYTETEKLPILADGLVTHVVTILRDVTARRQAEQAALAEGELRRAIERSTVAAVAAVDGSGRSTYVNKAFCDLTGWSEEELLGQMPPFAYWPPEKVEQINAVFQAILEGKPPDRSTELRFMRRSGERFDALVHAAPMHDSQGAVSGWVGSFVDITKRKRAERAMWLKELAIESATEAIALVDLAAKVIYVNRSLLQMWGVSNPAVLVGHEARDLFEADEATAAAWVTLQETGALAAELVARPAEGPGRAVHVTASTVRDEHGHPLGSILSIGP
jgi:PAS domain S-box-containing protein